jgi:hypothetical protein
VANQVVPHPEYVRFAAHYGFRPDFCEAGDPESKGMASHCTSWGRCDTNRCRPVVTDSLMPSADPRSASSTTGASGVVAAEAGVDPEHDLHGRLLAGMLVAGNRAAARRWVQSNGRLDLATLIGEVPDWAIRHFPDRAQTASRARAAAAAARSRDRLAT